MAKQYLISEEFAQALVDYLQTRPYVEVYKLIAGLVSLPNSPFTIQSGPAEKENKKPEDPKKDGKDANVPTNADRQIPE